jgi:acyl carrier protein
MEVMQELRALVADILGVDASQVVAESGPQKTDNWDSLAHLSIITAVEERFGIRFSMTDIRRIETFDALAKALSERLGK